MPSTKHHTPVEWLQGQDTTIRIDETHGVADRRSTLKQRLALSLIRKAVMLWSRKRDDDAIVIYDEVVRRVGDAAELPLRRSVATALINKAITLGFHGRTEEELAVYDEVIRRCKAAKPVLGEHLATGLVNKAVTLGSLKRNKEAIAAINEVVKRFGGATDPALKHSVAVALVNKGIILGSARAHDEENAVYDEVVRRFGDASEAAVKEQVATALLYKRCGSRVSQTTLKSHFGQLQISIRLKKKLRCLALSRHPGFSSQGAVTQKSYALSGSSLQVPMQSLTCSLRWRPRSHTKSA
jgi:hypothetical protein